MMRLWACLFVFWSAPVAAQDMTFELVGNGGNCGSCGWVAAEGTITAETPERFQAFVAEWDGYCPTVLLNSPGGDLAASVRLGRLMRAAGCATAVGGSEPIDDLWYRQVAGRCESACAFAYLGGEARFLEEVGEGTARNLLGVHQFFRREGGALPSAATQQIVGQLLLYVLDMGLDPEVLAIASRTPPGEMHHFSEDELQRLGLVTKGGATQMDFVLEQNGLAVTWEALGDSGLPARRAHLYCDASERAWILRVVEIGGAGGSLGFRPEDPRAMFIKVGEDVYRFASNDILRIEESGEDWHLEVRLPVDLSKRAGRPFFFQTSDARNWFFHLSAEGVLPDATDMRILRRTCVL